MTKSREKTPHLPAADWFAAGGFRTIVLAALTLIGIVLCSLLAWPFIAPIAWALALAVLFGPLHTWLLQRLKRQNLTAAIALLLIAIIVVVPAIFIGERLVSEAAKGAGTVEQSLRSGSWRSAIDASPRFAPVAQWIEERIDLAGAAGTVAGWVTSFSTAFLRGSVNQVISVLLTFYLLFFFLRDRESILDTLCSYSPMSAAEMNALFGRVSDTLNATLYGTVAVAAVQGTLGGLIFWALGLPSPLLWAVVMGLLSIVPVLGAFIIWVPAAVYFALQDNWQSAIILAVWGAVVISNVDNILYPIMVGRRLRLHNVAAFISVVGGLVAFGLSGVILGPLAVTVTLFLLETWRARVGLPAIDETTGPDADGD